MDEMRDRTDPLSIRRFIQIPGPNPIVRTGGAGEWDEDCLETCDILRDYDHGHEVYYLYYHALAKDRDKWPGGYRIGVATSAHPLGPFRKAAENPLLDLGPKGSWEDLHVACGSVIKQGPDKYLMWYSGRSSSKESGVTLHGKYHIGIATAQHPLGPWRKHEGNPIMQDFGYVGGVVLVNGQYYMYSEYPVGSTIPDFGPICLATATDPFGPWTRWEGNPVLAPEGWGAWDDGGYSEAKVVYRDGLFHLFYAGAKQHRVRINNLESIGYAFSRDGYRFTRHVDNPVALRETNPDASALAEVKCLFEPPFVYLYHTLRYLSAADTSLEHLGVQVLATSTPYKLSMPVLDLDELRGGAVSDLKRCPPISLDAAGSLALTVQCAYDIRATAGMRVHVRASADGFEFDTADWATFDNVVAAGQVARKTVDVSPTPRYIKVLVENLDAQHSVRSVTVTATLSS